MGSEDAVVSVSVDAGWGEDRGQAIQKLQGRETQGGPTGRVWFRQDVEDLVGTTVDEMEAFESEGRPGAVTDQPLEAGAVGGLDTDAGVEAKTATVIPGEHILGVVGFQETVAVKVTEDSLSDGVLEAFQELVGEGGGFVEAKVGFWMGETRIRVSLDPLEEPVHYAQIPPQADLGIAHAGGEAKKAARESFPDDLNQSPEFDPVEPEPIPDDDFDQSWDA
jgi:hypothetical protein